MEKLISEIKKRGIKITRPRREILCALEESSSPLSLNEIHDQIKEVDFASVFRNVKMFCSLNLVREINMGDKKIRYELLEKEHSHHIICSKCGKIQKLNICFLERIEGLTDYKITEHHMEFVGICPDCR
jgi:Fur family transcriptional regulator, ferric uptake regulator